MAVSLDDLDRRVTALEDNRLPVIERAHNESTATLRWLVATLGQMKAQQDAHTLQFEAMQAQLDGHTRQLDRHTLQLEGHSRQLDVLQSDVTILKNEFASLRRDLPSIVGDAVREALRETRRSSEE